MLPAIVYFESLVPLSNSIICLLQYRLGKNRSASGMRVRYSRSALSFHMSATQPPMTPNMMAVFPFQFAGREYQPPEGDHTCFGYLWERGWHHVKTP
ncbi:hypothetical protein DFP73DRAFT_562128 [Morchella snyderi]|nr:hypothetical protein DFP73DRAFT_562128 [Morchella snyderi]